MACRWQTMFSALHLHPSHPLLMSLPLLMETIDLYLQTERKMVKTVVRKVLKTGIAEW